MASIYKSMHAKIKQIQIFKFTRKFGEIFQRKILNQDQSKEIHSLNLRNFRSCHFS